MAKVADPSKTTICDPPLHTWQLRAGGSGDASSDRAQLQQVVNDNAARLGSGKLEKVNQIIATGHQAWLWHPGILAKDCAMMAAAAARGAGALHVVVDQDTLASDRIDVPMQQGDRLLVGAMKVLRELPPADVPSGLLPPMLVDQLDDIEVRDARRRVIDTSAADVAADLDHLRDAMRDLPECSSAAEQITAVVARLWRPTAGDVPIVFVSQLARLDAMKRIVRLMTADAEKCAAAYNAAVDQRPSAGVAPLSKSVGGGLRIVELPLWVVLRDHDAVAADLPGTRNPGVRVPGVRERVYFDMDADQLVTADWREVDLDRDLVLPRALTLTALLRSAYCDLFIHGTGGGVYDRITEQWWQQWQGELLAPMAVVTANLFFDFDAPVADRDELTHAIWFEHHLPHNVDRYVDSDARTDDDEKLIASKRAVLELMGQGGKARDYSRPAREQRAKLFAQLHEINAKLAANHNDMIEASTQQRARARQGVRNAAIAKKRDWCFALYGRDQIQQLRSAFEQQASPVES